MSENAFTIPDQVRDIIIINIQQTCTNEESWLSQVSLGQILVFRTDRGCWKRQQELFIIFGTKDDYCQVKLDKESAELYHSIVIIPLQMPSLRTSNQLPVVKYSNNEKTNTLDCHIRYLNSPDDDYSSHHPGGIWCHSQKFILERVHFLRGWNKFIKG